MSMSSLYIYIQLGILQLYRFVMSNTRKFRCSIWLLLLLLLIDLGCASGFHSLVGCFSQIHFRLQKRFRCSFFVYYNPSRCSRVQLAVFFISAITYKFILRIICLLSLPLQTRNYSKLLFCFFFFCVFFCSFFQ